MSYAACLRGRAGLAASLLVTLLALSRTAPAEEFRKPNLPEPLYLDLVRGLAPQAGELEANVLASMATSNPDLIEWAPEVEWAPVDDFAFEVEVPMENASLHALKMSAQLTLPALTRSTLHGLQAVQSYAFDSRHHSQLAYLLGSEFIPNFSVSALIGPYSQWVPEDASLRIGGALNVSMFLALPGGHAVGIENDLGLARESSEFTSLPQVHIRLMHALRVQAGIGIQKVYGKPYSALTALRVIVED